MISIDVLRPALAPSGERRLLQTLATVLSRADLSHCRIITAFARTGGVHRLEPHITKFRQRGGHVSVMVGVDVMGTSREALQFLLELVDEVYVTYDQSSSYTFHPKVYLVKGQSTAWAFVGSHNLTTGGLELNYEAGLAIDFDFPADRQIWEAKFEPIWAELLPSAHTNSVALNADLLAKLGEAGIVVSEKQIEDATRAANKLLLKKGVALPFKRPRFKPPTSLPKSPAAAAGAGPRQVYLMELSKGRGVSQAELGKIPYSKFFGGTAGNSVKITLTQLVPGGGRRDERRQLVDVKSKNYRVELGALVGRTHPKGSKRPIVMFLRTAPTEFDYVVLMPGAKGYANANAILDAHAGPPKRLCRRPILAENVVLTAWPDCPLLPPITDLPRDSSIPGLTADQ
jgi:HKD family nuclease